MPILGMNSVYHELAVALLRDHCIIAFEEERFSGLNHGKASSYFNPCQLPFNSMQYCLKENNLTIGDIDHVAYSLRPEVELSSKISDAFFNFKEVPRDILSHSRLILSEKPKCQFHFIEHHLAHAASAFFVSPIDEAAILTIDGIGERTCTLLARGNGNSITKMKELYYPNSLGFFYEEITKFLGFQRNNDEYKVMGLAAYGKPKYYDALRKLIVLKPEGEYQVNIDFKMTTPFNMGVKELIDVLGAPRIIGGKITERHADIAASAQKVLEDTVLHMLHWLYNKTKLKNLCMAGGVALNCVMNERIRTESSFENIFIQPAAHDAGTALGAALWVNHTVLNNPRECIMDNVYLGPEFSDAEIEAKLNSSKLTYYRSLDVARDAAELIADGKIIGWFQGKMEFGPRALGNRSILADPRDPAMKDKINKIKGREEFRPVAPAILEEQAGDFFESSLPSPFMQYARKVKAEKTAFIPAVVHVDGTARVQTVNSKQNALFYDLIKEFYLMTCVPVVINTSLNYKGKPIVCSIEQAIECFYNCGLDYLVLGNYILSKEGFKNADRNVIAERSANLALQR